MKIAIPKERRLHEARVAASPDSVKKYVGLGFEVVVETGAGLGAAITDQMFKDSGATIAADEAAALADADVVLKVQRPLTAEEGLDELALMKRGAVLVAGLSALQYREQVAAYAGAGVVAFAMEMMPRITRAQSMDILSSQSNLAGYKSVLDAAAEYGRALPMMMTAAGTVAPAKVLVLGAGVAGLQAIATAKRLGAVVFATDVRPAVKEQVESLGGKFLVVDPEMEKEAETAGGYAKDMPEDYKRKQREKVAEQLKKTDIAICTALIPGRKAPVLISEEMAHSMRPGSVIVDLAVEMGGNCPLSRLGEVVVTAGGVRIVGHANVPSRLAADASVLYAKNLLNFLTLSVKKDAPGVLEFNWDDEVIKGTGLTRDGKVVHPAFASEGVA